MVETQESLDRIDNKIIVVKALWYIVVTMMAIGFFLTALILYWLNKSYDPIVLKNATPEGYIRVENKDRVHNGEFVQLKGTSLCKTIKAEGSIRIFVGGITRPELIYDALKTERLPKGDCAPIDISLPIPKFTTNEPRHLEFEVTYIPNPVHKPIVETLRTEDFPIR